MKKKEKKGSRFTINHLGLKTRTAERKRVTTGRTAQVSEKRVRENATKEEKCKFKGKKRLVTEETEEEEGN